MRHRVFGRVLGRSSPHRRALRRNLVGSLFVHGRVRTTVAKAKECRPFAEKMITLAKVKNLHNIRRALQKLGNQAVVRKLFDEVAPRFEGRPGGYTRILRWPKRRVGDQAEQALLELVVRAEPAPAQPPEKGEKKGRSAPKKPAEPKKSAEAKKSRETRKKTPRAKTGGA